MISELEQLLPQTQEALDRFVTEIIEEFALPPGDDTYDAISTKILHINQEKAFVSKVYFANHVRKMIANKVAWTKCKEFADKRAEAERVEKQKTELTLVKPDGDASSEQPIQNA